MVKPKYIIVLTVLILGLVVSGCTDETSQSHQDTAVSANEDNPDVSIADETLNKEMVGVTDSEIQDIEAELAEIEALIDEMNQGEDISVEEI